VVSKTSCGHTSTRRWPRGPRRGAVGTIDHSVASHAPRPDCVSWSSPIALPFPTSRCAPWRQMTPGRRLAAAPLEGAAPEAKRPRATAAAEARHANAQRRKPGETDRQLRQRLDRNEYKRLMAQAKRSAASATASTEAFGTPAGSRAGPAPLPSLAPAGPVFGLFGLLSPPGLPAEAIATPRFALAAPRHPSSGGLLAYGGILPPPGDYLRPPPPAEYSHCALICLPLIRCPSYN